MNRMTQWTPEVIELWELLIRAIVELSYIEVLAPSLVDKESVHLIASSEGSKIVNDGMKLLGLPDLSDESRNEWLKTHHCEVEPREDAE